MIFWDRRQSEKKNVDGLFSVAFTLIYILYMYNVNNPSTYSIPVASTTTNSLNVSELTLAYLYGMMEWNGYGMKKMKMTLSNRFSFFHFTILVFPFFIMQNTFSHIK